MNPRFEAFQAITGQSEMHHFMVFISQMKSKYVKHYGLNESHPGGAFIQDHEQFTAFILKQVEVEAAHAEALEMDASEC